MSSMDSSPEGGSAPPPPANGEGAAALLKKGRATCDSCKLRKVKCITTYPGQPCEQCIRHSVPCLHTPHIRKKMAPRNGRRIAEAKEAAAAVTAEHPTGTLTHVDNALAGASLSSILALHLVQLWQHMPAQHLRLLHLETLSHEVSSVSGRLDLLPPDLEALTRTIMAQTAHLSSHPLLFGPPFPGAPAGVPAFDFSPTGPPPFQSDLREYGHRRASVCAQLREAAIKCVWEKGCMAKLDSLVNASACWIISRLVEDLEEGGGTPYLVSSATQFRLLAAKGVARRDSKWPFMMLLEALYSYQGGMQSSFNDSDFLMLCGAIPEPLDVYARQAQSLEGVVDIFDGFAGPFLYHAAALAREAVTLFTGPYARRFSLKPAAIQKYLGTLNSLYLLLVLLDAKGDALLNLMPILLPARSELLACRHLVNLAWCILALAPIQELRRRIAELDAADGVNATFVDRAAERDGLASQLNAARSVGAVAVRVLVGRLKDNIGLPWLSGQMLHFDWACWWELVRECPLGEVERRDATLHILDAAKLSGWSAPLPPADEFAIAEMTSYLAAPSQYDLTHQHLASGYSYISPTSLHRPSEAYLDPTSHLGPFLASGLPGSGSNSPPSQAQFNTAGTPSTPLFVDESISIRQFKEMADQWAKAAAEGGFVGGQGSMRGGETQGGYYG